MEGRREGWGQGRKEGGRERGEEGARRCGVRRGAQGRAGPSSAGVTEATWQSMERGRQAFLGRFRSNPAPVFSRLPGARRALPGPGRCRGRQAAALSAGGLPCRRPAHLPVQHTPRHPKPLRPPQTWRCLVRAREPQQALCLWSGRPCTGCHCPARSRTRRVEVDLNLTVSGSKYLDGTCEKREQK